MNDDTSNLTLLGKGETKYNFASPEYGMLEVFVNQSSNVRDYEITLECPEFTSLCPKTGQPDFGTIRITYIPKNLCVESKSLKLYLFAFRNEGSFMESITNKILSDMIKAVKPRYCRVTGEFAPRGGIEIVVEAEYTCE